MRKFTYLILIFSTIGCGIKETSIDGVLRYTKAQIDSLKIDSTRIIDIETNGLTKVDLNPFLKEQSFDFGSLVKEVRLIPFETTKESLLDAIYKVIVTDSQIYVYDKFRGGSLAIFGSDGKFVKRIPYGRGPGELIRLYDMVFDNVNNELIAYQHSFLSFFTPDGEFIRQFRLPFGFYNFVATDDGYVFKTLDGEGNQHLGHIQNYTLLITDKNFQLKSVGLPAIAAKVNFGGYHYMTEGDYLYITERFTDTIYQYIEVEERLKAKYVLDYRRKQLPQHHLQKTWAEFENAIRQNDYYFYLGQYIDSNDHQVFFLENWHKGIQTVVFRDKGSGKMVGGTNANYNLKEIPPIAFPKASVDDYFISWYYPRNDDLFVMESTIVSEHDKQKVKNLSQNDNPVLVFYKLKNF